MMISLRAAKHATPHKALGCRNAITKYYLQVNASLLAVEYTCSPH